MTKKNNITIMMMMKIPHNAGKDLIISFPLIKTKSHQERNCLNQKAWQLYEFIY